MTDMRIDCKVDVPVELQGGNYADAFRIISLKGDVECVLDFLSLSQCRTQASVVARIRVEKKFLTSIRDRLEATLEEIQEIQDISYGNLTSEQVDSIWDQSEVFDSEIEGEGAIPLIWFIFPEKVG